MEIYKVRDYIVDSNMNVKQEFTFSSILTAYEYFLEQVRNYKLECGNKFNEQTDVVSSKGGFYVNNPDIHIRCDILCETVDECEARVVTDEEILNALEQNDKNKNKNVATWPGME